MYIFVFLWTPVLMPSEPPLGMVFACFMVAIMIGSSLYAILLSRGSKPEMALKVVLWMLTVSITVCTLMAGPQRETTDAIILYIAFIILEVAFGIYFPAMSYLKSQIVPENHRANVMNWFRVPMNMITCSALLCMHSESFASDKRIMFGLCLVLCLIGLMLFSTFRKAMERRVVDLADKSESGKLLANDL